MRTDAAVSPSLATALEALRERGLGLRRGSEAPTLERSRPAVPANSVSAARTSAAATSGALA